MLQSQVLTLPMGIALFAGIKMLHFRKGLILPSPKCSVFKCSLRKSLL